MLGNSSTQVFARRRRLFAAIQAGVFCLDLPKQFSLDRIMNRVACESEERIHSVSRHGVQIYEARQLALILVMMYLASS